MHTSRLFKDQNLAATITKLWADYSNLTHERDVLFSKLRESNQPNLSKTQKKLDHLDQQLKEIASFCATYGIDPSKPILPLDKLSQYLKKFAEGISKLEQDEKNLIETKIELEATIKNDRKILGHDELQELQKELKECDETLQAVTERLNKYSL